MCIERYLRLAAGTILLAALGWAQSGSRYGLLLAAFVAANLLQSAFTNWCPLMSVLRALRVPTCGAAPAAEGGVPMTGR